MSFFTLDNTSNTNSTNHKHIGETHPFLYDGSYFHFGTILSSKVLTITQNDTTLNVQTEDMSYSFLKKS